MVICSYLLNHTLYFDLCMYTYKFEHCLDTGMQNNDETLLSSSLVDHGQLVKMLIILEPHMV